MGTGPAGSVFGENSFHRETRGIRLGGCHAGTEPSASCGYFCPHCPTGFGIRRKFVLSCPRGKWPQETCVGCPQQRHAAEERDKVQGRDCVETVEGVFCVPDPWGQYSAKFVLSRNPEYKSRGVDMWLNVVLIPE